MKLLLLRTILCSPPRGDGSVWVSEPGRALPELGGDRLGLVRAADQGADLLLVRGGAGLQAEPAGPVQQPLGRRDGVRAAAGDRAGQLERGLVRVGIDPGGQAY